MALVSAVPAPLPHPDLPGADWSDRRETVVTPAPENAEAAVGGIFNRMPRWTWPLLVLPICSPCRSA